ncbi:MAG: nuclear transport factor 2 family protein [Actinobacteria bacterium]|nr:nuclear transport factor 2 family protein [Actinomycetota bacterium]
MIRTEASDNSQDTTEEEIWTLEEAYFTNLYKAEHAAVLSVLHKRFLAWPDSMEQPIDVEGSARFMRRLAPEPTSCSIRIEREGIRVLGGIALTQFKVHVSDGEAAAAGNVRSSRITHTWVKDGESWKLLGGMSCDL